MKRWLLLAILALPSLCFAQGVRFDNIALQAANPLQGIPNAVITVCTSAGTGKPCAPLATTYTDATLATPCPGGAQVTLAGSNTCVTTGDSLGNFGFWLAANATYIYTVTAPGLPGYSTSITISCPTSGNCTFTGNVTFTNTITGSVTGNAGTATTATNLAGPGSITGNYTSTGTLTLNQLQGCQYVNSTQTFAQALAAVSNPGCIWITPGTYAVAANSTIAAGIDLISVSGGVLSIANTFTLTINGGILAPATPSAPLFAYVGSGVVAFGGQAMPINPLWMPGADIGAQINNAYASSPASGSYIKVSPGTYSYTTPIVISTATKPLNLECSPGVGTGNPSSSATTFLRYTATTGTAFAIDNGQGNFLNGCALQGAGVGNTTIGFQAGLTVGGFQISRMMNFDISGFGVGLQFGNNAYIDTFFDNYIHDNGANGLRNVYVPSGTTGTAENLQFIGGAVANKGAGFSANCFEIDAPFEFSTWGTSFDQCGVTSNANNVFLKWDSHMENPNGTTTTPFFTFGASSNNSSLTIIGGEWLEDGTAGARTEFIRDNSTVNNHYITVNVQGGEFIPGETVAQLINLGQGAGGSCCARAVASGYVNGFGGSTFTNPVGGSGYVGFTTNSSTGTIGFGNLAGLNSIVSNSSAARTNTLPDASFTFAGKDLAQTWTAVQTLGAGSSLNLNSLLISPTVPTITAGGCGGSAASISAPNGTASFNIFTGTAPTSGGCTITMPAATTDWHCEANHTSAISTTNFIIQQTGALSTTSVTLQLFSDVAAATAPTASDTWRTTCTAN